MKKTYLKPIRKGTLIMDYKIHIDDIYTSRSVYKSLIICHDNYLTDKLVQQLREDNYPISTLQNIEQYLIDQSRILIIDYIDYSNLEQFIDADNLNKINLVIFINSKSPKISSALPDNCDTIDI